MGFTHLESTRVEGEMRGNMELFLVFCLKKIHSKTENIKKGYSPYGLQAGAEMALTQQAGGDREQN